MKYMGSKNRHAKELLPIILNKRFANQWYVEPFVGGFNMIDKVTGNRIANDINPYLIALFKALQEGWTPPLTISEDEYADVKNNKDNYPAHLVGFIGFGCSYSGKWFGGYARGGYNNDGTPRNYATESRKNLIKQQKTLDDVIIKNQNYQELFIPPDSIIYCDPPYTNTTKYKDDFNHDEFWDWCREMVNLGHDVFVSEYTAPDDFISIWKKDTDNILGKKRNTKHATENLFVKK